jgi:hypothetical protein
MAQVFHRSTNTISKFSISGGVIALAVISYAAYQLDRSSYVTHEQQPMEQPIPFSHKHHSAGLGIDCRYCHTTVETAAYAGMPATETCMSCHSQIWRESPQLELVRASYASNTGIRWRRVYDLPNFVYFDHSIHVNKGVGCSECHGRVDRMPLTWKNSRIYMQWCLDCHREPEKHLRPQSEIFKMNWVAGSQQETLGAKLLKENHTPSRSLLTSCSTCHR